MRILFLVCVLGISTTLTASAESEPDEVANSRTSPVGMPARLEQIVLSGSELVAKPIDAQGPMVLRIVRTFPHGSDFRYDIEYYGLEPGKWNLANFLERKDGSEIGELTDLTVEITTMLPPGQVEPNKLAGEPVQGLGGYQLAMILGGVAWGIGLLAILFVGRKKADSGGDKSETSTSLADRLRPIVQQAIAGELSSERLAELEMMLVAFWRKRLDIEHADAAEVIPRLRAHNSAGPLLIQLEEWLHQPGSNKAIDIAVLLEPYRDLPPDALEASTASASSS